MLKKNKFIVEYHIIFELTSNIVSFDIHDLTQKAGFSNLEIDTFGSNFATLFLHV